MATMSNAGNASSSSNANAAATTVQTLRIRPPAFTEGKLDGTNYTLWKFKIMAIIDSYELLKIVLGIGIESPMVPDVESAHAEAK